MYEKAAATIRCSPDLGRVLIFLLLFEKIREKGLLFLLLQYDALLLLFIVSSPVNYLSDLGSDDLDRMEDA